MSNEINYDRYFRIVTLAGDKPNTAGIGVEEYDPNEHTDGCILFFASIYLDDGGRSQAIRKAIRTIQTQIQDDERVVIRINGRAWRVWREIYTQYKITNLKRNRSGWCAMLAQDAVKRGTTISERLK